MTTTSAVELAPRVSWGEFLDRHFRWYPGQHIGLIGPTNSGKTTLLLQLLPMRKYVTVVGTKPRDVVLKGLESQGYVRMARWDKSIPAEVLPRRLLWPDATRMNSLKNQRDVIAQGLMEMYQATCWCVAIDELWYLIHMLKLEQFVRVYLQQARSLNMSIVVATQRPAFVPLEVYDQSTHLFFWLDNDERNLRRISGISYRSSKQVRETVAHLVEHEVLYVNTITGEMVRTMCEVEE